MAHQASPTTPTDEKATGSSPTIASPRWVQTHLSEAARLAPAQAKVLLHEMTATESGQPIAEGHGNNLLI